MRRWLIGGTGLLAAGLLGHAGWWWHVTGLELGGVARFGAEAARAGWQATSGVPRRASWPRLAVHVPGVRMARPGFSWEAEEVRLFVPLLSPGSLGVEPLGVQSVQVGASPAVPFRAERMVVWFAADGGPGEVEARGVVGADWRVGGVRWNRAGPMMTLGVSDGHWAEADAVAGEVRLVASPGWPVEDLEAWQRLGGAVAIDGTFAWGGVAGALVGEAALDARLEPVGRGRLTIERPGVAIDALVAAGMVGPGGATAMRGVAGLLAPEGGRVTVPVAVADGRLSVSGFGVTRLPWAR